MMPKHLSVAAVLATMIATAQAAPSETPPGTVVALPATGEVRHVNDQATVIFSTEETHADKAVAASRVNQKMKQGLALIKKEDPQAILATERYYTYPVYPDASSSSNKPRVPIAWRVGQSLRVTTSNLTGLPSTVAGAQAILSLNNLRFGLTPATERQLDDERIAATYANLQARIHAVAVAMGRSDSDATLEAVDFEGAASGVRNVIAYASNLRAAPAPGVVAVEEPSFEPGETTLSMRAVGKVRFKQAQ